jgi:hypothetical protein
VDFLNAKHSLSYPKTESHESACKEKIE